MQSIIDRIVEMFKDGKWHTINELSKMSQIHEFKIEIMTDFLADYSFLEFNKKERKAKSSIAFGKFLKRSEKENYGDINASKLR